MPIDEQTRAEAQVLARRYPVARAALLPMLHLVQSADGYVSEDGIALCAEVLGITKAEVASVSTFYTMYKREQVGDWLLSVCTNPTCQIAGGQAIYDDYVKALGGRHDADAGVTVEHAECLGICGDAPVVQINYEMYGRLSHADGMALLDAAKKGEPPVALSGVTPPRFRAVERELSGIDDGVDEHLAEAAAIQQAMEHPPVWRSGETFVPGVQHAEGLLLDQTPTSAGGAA
jgi:NADH-quinone oxidoreductase subunit E